MEVRNQLHAPAALPPETNRKMRRSQRQQKCFGEHKKPLPLPGTEPRIVQPVSQLLHRYKCVETKCSNVICVYKVETEQFTLLFAHSDELRGLYRPAVLV